jgi:Transposase DDE domain
MHPSEPHAVGQQRRVGQIAGQADAANMFNLLTGPQLLDSVEALLPEHRERLYPPTETLAMFVAQVLSSDGSCQGIVDAFQVQRLAIGLTPGSPDTSAYCKARRRLPMELIQGIMRQCGHLLTRDAPRHWHWRGRRVLLTDGTTTTLPDNEVNQAAYPQPESQKPGLGFPMMRIQALICLGSGALCDAATGPCVGKGGEEQTLLREMLDNLERGDILLGDAFYATYFLLAELIANGIDGLFEQYGARKRSTDFALGEVLGKQDHIVVLSKPKKCPDWMSPEEYARLPETLKVREVKCGGKLLVTTFLNAKDTPNGVLKALYRRRWHVELDIRNIKTTLGMETLRCKSPEMACKELWVYLLAYNLIRLLMAQSAWLSDQIPRQLSFKHTVQVWTAWTQIARGSEDGESMYQLMILIARPRVGLRSGRIEPRLVKRRRNRFGLLMEPRADARERVRAFGHPKKQR